MTLDAIVGARYNDEMFESEFTVTEVYAESDSEIADEDEIYVVMQYDIFDVDITVSLDAFRDNTQISVIEVPSE